MENKTPFMSEIPEKEPQRQQYFMAHAKEQLHILEENLGRPLTCCINTFGCQMNARDSEKLLGILETIGYQAVETEDADFVLYNTCTVRENANLRVYGRLGQLGARKKRHPHMMIALCGCMMQEKEVVEKIKKTGAPIVVGLDPMLNYIPQHVLDKAYAEYGETLEGAAEAVWQFNKEIVDKTYDLIPAVKPQIAMYEQFGIPGLMAFKKTVDYCKSKDLVIIGDVKRGDIGSTSAAYATAHLGKIKVGSKEYTPFGEDFATVNPYLGSDGVNPFVDVCKEEKKGLFILVKTSNPSSGEFQDRIIDGRPLYEWVGEKVAEWGADCMGDEYSYIGAVVGATYPEMGKVLREIMPKSYILVPGYGAQGGQGKDLVHFFNEDGLGAIVNSSRGIIAAYKQEAYAKFGPENFGDASRAAVEAMVADISGALAAAK